MAVQTVMIMATAFANKEIVGIQTRDIENERERERDWETESSNSSSSIQSEKKIRVWHDLITKSICILLFYIH